MRAVAAALQVLTKAWTAALLNAVGDILAQKVIEKEEHLDLKRLCIFSFLVSSDAVRACPECERRGPCK